MKLERSSSRFFIVTAVLFEDREQAEKCDRRIDRIREDLGYHKKTEFHFNRTQREVRLKFLQDVSEYEFFYFSIVVNKAKLVNPVLKERQAFYQYTMGLVFQNAKTYLQNATVVIDRSGSEDFQQQLAKYLKRRTNQGDGITTIRKVRTEKSHTNNLLQLADMVCGAVARSFAPEKKDHRAYRAIIRHRELDLRVWPK